MDTERLDRHRVILGYLYIVSNALGLLMAGALGALFLFAGSMLGDLQSEGGGVFMFIGLGLVGMLALFSLPGLVAGVGLLQHKRWAKVLAMVLGVIGLLNFPLGTLLGIYTLWFGLQAEADALFVRR
jgi:hypothetical protein